MNALNGADAAGDLTDIAEQVSQSLRVAPVDARLYSLMGEVKFQLQEPEAAQQWFERARIISKTEVHALQRTIYRSVEEADLDAAITLIDVLLRRWPEKFEVIASACLAIMAREEGYRAVLTAIEEDPPWRSRLVGAVARDPAAVALAYRLMVDLKDAAVPPSNGELQATISALVRHKNYDLAHRLFLLTLTPEEQRHNGYVHNATFAPVFTGRLFDWQVQNQSSAEITLPKSGVSADQGAVIRFLNKPVKELHFQQYLSLPPGDYTAEVEASARNLKLPKDLFWLLRCVEPGQELARLHVPEGSYDRRTLSVDFRISEECSAELLQLETALIAKSFRYRYTGALTLHSVRIERD